MLSRYGYGSWLLLALIVFAGIYSVSAATRNGFDLDGSLIGQSEILSGGPPRDGIPAIDKPRFIDAASADFLDESDRVLGISINGLSKAYPISILNWHEIVNDEANGKPFVITYCPLCGSGIAFSANIDDERLSFGVSGLLYNSDVLLYDRQTESLWSQIKGQAVTGAHRGRHLERLVLTHTRWGKWRQEHPQTLVLSTETGYSRDYERNPYAGYEQSRSLYFQVSNRAPDEFHPKERVLGLEIDGRFKAYPFIELKRSGKTELHDDFDGKAFTVRWDAANDSASIEDSQGRVLPAIESFWFAWFAFHPDTLVYRYSDPNER